ncbi:MAG TPA: malonyl-CoA synthase [Magnetospirillaceae bacterium]|nr:malonyl-CoA synthase [Magnetospirillaceae bacterium]
MNNLYAAFRAAFPQDLSRVCLETDRGRAVTYREIEEQSGRIAALLDKLGVKPGERVTVQVDKSPEALFLYLACLRAGVIYMPLNSGYTATELDYFLSDARPALVVSTPKAFDEMRELAAKAGCKTVLTLGADGHGALTEQAQTLAPRTDIAATEPDDVAAMLYTSGTTGRSKGALLTHRSLIANAETLVEAWGFTEEDVLLHTLPIFHVHGLFVAFGCALLSRAKMLFHPTFDAASALAAMGRATVFMGVPTYYTRLLASPELNKAKVANMRLFVSGSAPLLAETFSAFHQRTGHHILERYGMTETGMNTSNPLIGERRLGTVGFPLSGVELRIADDEGREVAKGETGIIEVRGPNVLKGYWNNPEKTAAAFRADGFFITGDVAQLDADGYVVIVGRASDMIISGGYNVYPKEIETVIDALPGIGESAVIGVPHPDFGEGVVAVIRTLPGKEHPAESEIVAALKSQLAGYKVPKKLVFVEDLPRNAMGKVVKAELRKANAALFQ